MKPRVIIATQGHPEMAVNVITLLPSRAFEPHELFHKLRFLDQCDMPSLLCNLKLLIFILVTQQ